MVERVKSKMALLGIPHMGAEYFQQGQDIIESTGATSLKVMYFDGNAVGIDTSKEVVLRVEKSTPLLQLPAPAKKKGKGDDTEPTAEMVIEVLREGGDMFTKDISNQLGIPLEDTPTRQKVAKVLKDLLEQKVVKIIAERGKFREYRLVEGAKLQAGKVTKAQAKKGRPKKKPRLKSGYNSQDDGGGPAGVDITRDVVLKAISDMGEETIVSLNIGDHLKIPRNSTVRIKLSKIMTNLWNDGVLSRTGVGSATTYRLPEPAQKVA